MSDATGKVILTTILNGLTHAVLPPLGLYIFTKFSEDTIFSMNAFLALLAFIILMSFLMNFISFAIIQSSVCGKVFNTEHLLRLAGFGITFSVLFFRVVKYYNNPLSFSIRLISALLIYLIGQAAFHLPIVPAPAQNSSFSYAKKIFCGSYKHPGPGKNRRGTEGFKHIARRLLVFPAGFEHYGIAIFTA